MIENTKNFRIKTSSVKLRNLKKLSKRQSAGTLDKRQATSLIIKALNPRSKPITIGLNEVYKIGFETVLDAGIDREICQFCGKYTCKTSKYNIPFETLERLNDYFNFDCNSIYNCIKANEKEYLEKDKVKTDIKVLKNEIKNVLRKIKHNENLLNGFYVSAKRQKIESFESRKRNTFNRFNRFSFPISKSLRKFEIKANKKAMFQTLTLVFNSPILFSLKSFEVKEIVSLFFKFYFEKAKFDYYFQNNRKRLLAYTENLKANKQRKRINSKVILTKVEIDLTEQISARCKVNLVNLRNELKELQKELNEISVYKIPVLLTIEKEKQLIENCKKLKGKKLKFAMYKKLATENFLASF